MNNDVNNLPPFFVGQEVVCIKTSYNSLGMGVVEGNKYKIFGLIKCKCGKWKCDVGERSDFHGKSYCDNCKFPFSNYDKIGWCNCFLFAPIDQTFQSITYSKVMEKESELINVN